MMNVALTSNFGEWRQRWAQLTTLALVLAASTAHADVSDSRFVEETLFTGTGTISIVFGPGDRMYVAEKVGRVLLFMPNGQGRYGQPSTVADISSMVDPAGESGLLGMALDPAFETNRHVFLLFTTPTDQRLVRITLNATFDQIQGSVTPVLSGFPRVANFHKGGDIHFDPSNANAILIALGDDGDRPASQNLDRYEGKILRVDKATGRGVTDNPFYMGDGNNVRSRVWAYGLRNPFRFTFHPALPHPDVIYVSENGDSTDRISRVRRGSNGAWNAQGDTGGFLNPPDTNHRVLAPRPGAAVVGIAIARGGPFVDPAHPNDDVLFVAEAGNGGVLRRYRLFGTDLDQIAEVSADLPGGFSDRDGHGYAFGAHVILGPDGAIYMSQTGGGDSPGTHYGLRRIRFVAGAAPRASFTTAPTPASGSAPLTVRFTDTSTDSDDAITTRSWTFGDGTTGTGATPSHTYSTAGTYTVALTVTDESGLRGTASTTVTATSSHTLHLIAHLRDARRASVVPLAAASEIRLYESDGTTPVIVSGGGSHVIPVPAGGELDTTVSTQSLSDQITITAGELASDGVHPAARTVALSNAATQTVTLTFNLSATAISGRVLDTRGRPAPVDVGIAREQRDAPYAFEGGRDLTTTATGIAHRLTADVGGHFYFPIREGDGGARFFLDTTRDTHTQTYTAAHFNDEVAEGQLLQHDLLVGLWSGGAECDDISNIAVTRAINYAEQIQPIWDESCIGCHAPGTANTGGLDLTGDSLPRLLNIESRQVPGLMMIQPGQPQRSYLLEKINCASPQHGTRMRPTDAMPANNQALIRDFIAQLAATPPNDAGSSNGGTGGSTDGGGSGGGSGGSRAVKSSGCQISVAPTSVWQWTLLAPLLLTVRLLRRRR